MTRNEPRYPTGAAPNQRDSSECCIDLLCPLTFGAPDQLNDSISQAGQQLLEQDATAVRSEFTSPVMPSNQTTSNYRPQPILLQPASIVEKSVFGNRKQRSAYVEPREKSRR